MKQMKLAASYQGVCPELLCNGPWDEKETSMLSELLKVLTKSHWSGEMALHMSCASVRMVQLP